MKEVVVIGGGTGSYNVLKGLREYDELSLTSIVSMMDNGGSSGVLRDVNGVLPPGDIRRALIALSEESDLLKALFEYRFDETEGFLAGHNLGNLIITGLIKYAGDSGKGIELAGRLLKVRGRALPVTLDLVNLHAILENGEEIVGETNIDIPKHDPNIKIDRIYLAPTARANPKALEAIMAADYVVIGPGDLYTSIIPNFLVESIPQVVAHSRAQTIYVCNIMTKHGETDDFAVSDFVHTLENYTGTGVINHLIVNIGVDLRPALQNYREENAFPVINDSEKLRGFNVIEADVRYQNGLIRHDPAKLAATLVGLMDYPI